jgi:hypothetical protein
VKREEQELQRAAVHLLELLFPPYISPVVWFHVPNGGARSKAEAAILKGLGVRAGVSDLVLLWGASSAVIELKTDSGRLAQSQVEFFGWCDVAGVPTAVCRSLPEVERALRDLVARGMPEPRSWSLGRRRQAAVASTVGKNSAGISSRRRSR